MLDLPIGNHVKPTRFYGYPTTVSDRFVVLVCDTEEKKQLYRTMKHNLILLFKANGMTAHDDNKIAFECDLNGHKLFYGFKDWVFTIGFGIFIRPTE